MLNNFFFINSNIFFYIECNFFILYSFLGIIKVKNKDLIRFFWSKNIIYTNYFINQISFFLHELFLLINNGYFNKFKIIGVGYRQFYSNNMVIYKLRYSHLIYNILPLDIITFKKKKNKKYFTLFSLNKNRLNKILHLWLLYRVPNVYTKKGFFKKGKKYNFKKMVKKLL